MRGIGHDPGRPRTHAANEARRKNIDPQEIERLATLGLGHDLIASILNVHRDTLRSHMKKNPELAEKFHQGSVNIKTQVRAQLLKQALGGNTRVLLRVAQSYGLIDPEHVEVTGKNGGALQHEHTSDHEAIEALTAALGQLEASARTRGVVENTNEVAQEGSGEATPT